MKQHIKLGVVCLARETFDYRAAREQYKKIQADLGSIENIEVTCIDELVIEVEDARKAADVLGSTMPDGLICISGTFHLGHLVLEINKRVNKPLMLWGIPELPYDGGKIRLNSVCGVNLNASNLYKSGIRDYHVHVGHEIDTDWVDAVRINAALSDTRIGLAGFRAHGFFNLAVYDLNAYREMGVLIDHFELGDIMNTDVSENAVKSRTEMVNDTFDCTGVSNEQVQLLSSLAEKFSVFMDSNGLDSLAVRCWPEFASLYGIAPCAAMSILQSENRIMACEGDIEGALSMVAHRAAGADTPFLFDFSQVNFDDDTALLWHCGVAPVNLWDRSSVCSLDTYFAGGRGVTADFVLKTGDVSILRIDSAPDEYRIFLQEAKGIPMEKELKGTYLKVRFDRPVKEIFDTVVYNGIAHHASMVYGKYIRPFEIFARIKGWRTVT